MIRNRLINNYLIIILPIIVLLIYIDFNSKTHGTRKDFVVNRDSFNK